MFQKIFSVGKNLWRRDCGYYFFPLNFLSHSAKNNLSFEKILVSKIFMHRSGDATMICRNFFVSHDRKTSYWVPCVSEIFSYGKKFMDNRWWGVGYQVIPSKMFLSHSAEKVRGVTLQCFRKPLMGKNLWRRDGGITFFRRKFFVSQCRKFP